LNDVMNIVKEFVEKKYCEKPSASIGFVTRKRRCLISRITAAYTASVVTYVLAGNCWFLLDKIAVWCRRDR